MTPAVQVAKQAGVVFSVHQYEHDPHTASFGREAAEKLGAAADTIFKTLVVQTDKGELAITIVPVMKNLDLKAAASTLSAKKVRMADKSLVQRTTGYIPGGVSPLGQKKQLPTLIDSSAENHQQIYISAGRRGLEIALSPGDLVDLCNATLSEISC
jgi:Cys-tRNA(Pro)/Cys-tRNA(Cys) deacylase